MLGCRQLPIEPVAVPGPQITRAAARIRKTHQDARVPAAADRAGGRPGAAGNPSSCADPEDAPGC
ncbi:hypothetical protein [Paenibacillus solani]|uniref:hypothetical protein n=1 Tax=Paenibacillus solani TaxID=1705565 RepID=UPI003D2AA3D3